MAETNFSDNQNISETKAIPDSYLLLAPKIYLSLYVVLLILGVFGNFLSLIVWNKGPRCKDLSCALYFKILALSDIVVLISFCACDIYMDYFSYREGYGLCEIHSVIQLIRELGPQISPWIIVTLSADRTLTIILPLKCAWKPSKKRIWISFVCIMSILVILNCLWIVKIKNSEITFFLCSLDDSWIRALKFSDTLNIWVLAILPFSFILLCSVLILTQMFQMRKMTAVTRNGRRKEVFATFTILTVVTGILHCVSVIPKILFNIALDQESEYGYNFLNYSHNDNYFTDIFWSYFPYVSILFNNSLNCYVYCVAGRDFRKDLMHVLTCRATRNNTRDQIV